MVVYHIIPTCSCVVLLLVAPCLLWSGLCRRMPNTPCLVGLGFRRVLGKKRFVIVLEVTVGCLSGGLLV